MKDFRRITRGLAQKTAGGLQGETCYPVDINDLCCGTLFNQMIARVAMKIQAHRRKRNKTATIKIYYYLYDPSCPENERPRFVIKEMMKQTYTRKLWGWIPIPAHEYSNAYTLVEIDDDQETSSPKAVIKSYAGDAGLVWLVVRELDVHEAHGGKEIAVYVGHEGEEIKVVETMDGSLIPYP